MVCGGKGSIKMGIYANERAFFYDCIFVVLLMGGYMSSARIEFGVN